MPSQLLARLQQLGLIAGSGERADPDVVGDVEGGSVDPQRPAQPQPGSEQQLPEARDLVEPRLELPAPLLDPDATVAVEQAGAVEDGEPADVGGPPVVVPQEQEQIRRGQPFQQACLVHHACFGMCPANTRRMTLWPKSAVGPNMQGQPPSITVMPRCRPNAVAAAETLPVPGPRCIQTCVMPSSAHWRIVSSAISGRVPITTAWTPPGIDFRSW